MAGLGGLPTLSVFHDRFENHAPRSNQGVLSSEAHFKLVMCLHMTFSSA